MYPSNVLQYIPQSKVPCPISGFYILIIAQAYPQLIRYLLLCHASSFSGLLQFFSHGISSFVLIFAAILYLQDINTTNKQ